MNSFSVEERYSLNTCNVSQAWLSENSTLKDLFNKGSYEYFTLIYFVGSLLSIVCLFAIITTLVVQKSLRKHPAHLVVCRVCSDLIVSIAHVVFYLTNYHTDTLFKEKISQIQYTCRPFSAAIEFGMISGYTWNLMFAVDLLLAVRRPFKLHGSYIKYYHATVWTLSLLITAIFIAIPLQDWQPYGMSMFFHCWVNVAVLPNYIVTSTLIYFLPTFVIFCIGCLIGFRVVYSLRKVSLFSPYFKGHIAKMSLGMLCGLGIDWLVTLTLWISNITITNIFGVHCSKIEGIQVGLTYVYAIIHSNRGCIVLMAWIYSLSARKQNERRKNGTPKNTSTKNRYRGSESKSRSSTSSNQDRVSMNSDERSPLMRDIESSEDCGLIEYMFNSELRRYAVVCINYSILDSAKTAQSQIAGFSQGTFQAHVTMDEVIQKSTSMGRKAKYEVRTIQIPTNFMYHKFEFINYSPLVFKNLRDLRGIDEGEFMKSFPLQDNETTAMMEKFTEGKSGSFFFFSYDKKYIVKTISNVELLFMIDNLQAYSSYLMNNPDSLLTRYYGMVKLRFTSQQEFIIVVVMENVFYLEEGMVLEERYDLKGSVINRQTVKRGMKRPRNKTMKDMDMDSVFKFKEVTMRNKILCQLEKDTEYLQTQGAMDYSLLVGVTATSEDGSITFSTSMQNNVYSGSEKEISIADTSFQWIDYNPQNLHWYRNGTRREHAPSSMSNLNGPIINPVQSLFSQFRKGYFKVPAEKILKIKPTNEETHEKEPCFLYIGIIDMLQPYNMEKKLENMFKTKIRRLKEEKISSVQPYLYRARFMHFVRESVFYC